MTSLRDYGAVGDGEHDDTAALQAAVNAVSPTAAFHAMYYADDQRTWNNTYWLGTMVKKCPLDLWVYQEIIHQTRPDLIIETGTCKGGSALFLASMCDLVNHGLVLTIDIETLEVPQHIRIAARIIGSSTSSETISRVKHWIEPDTKVMVILDSDHSKKHVLEELRLYAPLVSKGCYLIVEDTNLGTDEALPGYRGPAEAVAEFLEGNNEFIVDRECEKFYLTFNPGGYLMKVA
jgi:cephalosporin hydroxylase